MLTRRTATVIISLPLARVASRVVWKSGYFPLPTIRRLVNSYFPILRISLIFFLLYYEFSKRFHPMATKELLPQRGATGISDCHSYRMKPVELLIYPFYNRENLITF